MKFDSRMFMVLVLLIVCLTVLMASNKLPLQPHVMYVERERKVETLPPVVYRAPVACSPKTGLVPPPPPVVPLQGE